MSARSQYRIRILVRGELPTSWSALLAGLSVAPNGDDSTTIAGEVLDEAALHGVLGVIRDLGLPIVSIRSDAKAAERPEGSDARSDEARAR